MAEYDRPEPFYTMDNCCDAPEVYNYTAVDPIDMDGVVVFYYKCRNCGQMGRIW